MYDAMAGSAKDKLAAKLGELLMSIKSGNTKASLYKRREQIKWQDSNRMADLDT